MGGLDRVGRVNTFPGCSSATITTTIPAGRLPWGGGKALASAFTSPPLTAASAPVAARERSIASPGARGQYARNRTTPEYQTQHRRYARAASHYKLQVANRAEAIAWAWKNGLVEKS